MNDDKEIERPLEIFFKALERTDSKEEAMKALRIALVKRKLKLPTIEEEVEKEFEEIWDLMQKEEILSKIVK